MPNPPTAADLMAYAKRQARIYSRDYFEPGYARADEIAAWRSDVRRRDQERARILRDFPGRLRSTEPLVPGNYFGTRLAITAEDIDYTAGQYAPTEIYSAIYDYFEKTNNLTTGA